MGRLLAWPLLCALLPLILAAGGAGADSAAEENSSYTRLPDGELQGRSCFLVEAVPYEHVNSEYSKFRVWVDKQRPIVLRARYWDDRDIEIKELDVEPASIELINDVWVARRMSMYNIKSDSFTKLRVSEIQPNVELQRSDFDLTRLVGH